MTVICATKRNAIQPNSEGSYQKFQKIKNSIRLHFMACLGGTLPKTDVFYAFFISTSPTETLWWNYRSCCVALRKIQLPYMLTVLCATQQGFKSRSSLPMDCKTAACSEAIIKVSTGSDTMDDPILFSHKGNTVGD